VKAKAKSKGLTKKQLQHLEVTSLLGKSTVDPIVIASTLGENCSLR
jgi:hypothetical protein